MLLEEFYRFIGCSEEDIQLRLMIARRLHELEARDYNFLHGWDKWDDQDDVDDLWRLEDNIKYHMHLFRYYFQKRKLFLKMKKRGWNIFDTFTHGYSKEGNICRFFSSERLPNIEFFVYKEIDRYHETEYFEEWVYDFIGTEDEFKQFKEYVKEEK